MIPNREQVDEDFRTAVRHKVESPPTLFINGIVYERPRTADALADLIGKLGACASQLRELESETALNAGGAG